VVVVSCRAVVVLFSRDEAALLCGLASEVRIKLAESCRKEGATSRSDGRRDPPARAG